MTKGRHTSRPASRRLGHSRPLLRTAPASADRLIQINADASPVLSPCSLAIIPGRTNVSTYDLMVIAAVLFSFASFSAVLAFATFDESRRRRPK